MIAGNCQTPTFCHVVNAVSSLLDLWSFTHAIYQEPRQQQHSWVGLTHTTVTAVTPESLMALNDEVQARVPGLVIWSWFDLYSVITKFTEKHKRRSTVWYTRRASCHWIGMSSHLMSDDRWLDIRLHACEGPTPSYSPRSGDRDWCSSDD